MNSPVTVILFGFFLTFWTCSEQAEEIRSKDPVADSVVLYNIPAGAHYSQQSSFHTLTASSIRFKARFDSSAIYQTRDESNQGDINKLYGLSDCNSGHQVNSARFGWRWFDHALQIWAYAYVNSERKMAFVGNVSLGSMDTYEISFTDSTYRFKVGETEVSLPRHCSGEATGYKLYPYFGGDEPAPHEVIIGIKDIQ